MTDRQALLAAIRAHPDEDTPRLAFADWLDEQGDTFFAHWAELIRVQIDAASAERFSRRWLELAREQKRLFALRPKEWTPTWHSRLGPMAYRRGFREAAHLDPDSFPMSFDRVFGSNPIRAVSMNLARAPAGRSKIAEYPGLAFVEALDLAANGTVSGPRFLREAAQGMPRLRALGLRGVNLSASQADDILGLPGLGGLDALDLSNNPLFHSVTHGRPETLFRAPVMGRVRWLDLADTELTITALEALADSPRLRNLRTLDLACTAREGPSGGPVARLGRAGAFVLGGGLALRGVEYLDLTGHRIGAVGVRVLAPVLANVRELILADNDLGDDGAAALAATPQLANLRRLELGGNHITILGTEELLASPHLSNLTVVDGVPTTPEALERFPPVAGEPFAVSSESLFRPCP